MRRNLVAGLFPLALLLPAGLAHIQVDEALADSFFAERVRYYRHLTPPDRADAVYDLLGYGPEAVRAGAAVPRRFLTALPAGLERIPDPEARKRAFIAVLLPLVLRVNELIAQDRNRLLALESKIALGRRLTAFERLWLERLARRYGVEGPVIPVLKRRVDTIPVSLAIAQAAIESGWGRSYFARVGNAIYGQWTWDEEADGIVPRRRPEGKRYRLRAFGFLIDSVRGYAENLNRGHAYRDFRRERVRLRTVGLPVSGSALASTLVRYSERREAYIADLLAIIRTNGLEALDDARLAPPRGRVPLG